MTTIQSTDADARVAEIDTLLVNLAAERKRLMPSTTIACEACGYRSLVGDLVLYHEQYYVAPHGCASGDYWYTCALLVRCSSCGSTRREKETHGVLGKLIPYVAGNASLYKTYDARPEIRLTGEWDAARRDAIKRQYTTDGWYVNDQSKPKRAHGEPEQ